MTCDKRDECRDIDSLRLIGNAMKRKLDDQRMELRRQAIRIGFLEDMIEAERRVDRFVAGIATVVSIVLAACLIASMRAGGVVA